jgi:hypothetical protein
MNDILGIIDTQTVEINEVLSQRDDDALRSTLRDARSTLSEAYVAIKERDAEIDRLHAAHAADCIRFAEILEREGFRMDGRVYRAKAAALAAPADSADADAADGSEGR